MGTRALPLPLYDMVSTIVTAIVTVAVVCVGGTRLGHRDGGVVDN